MEKTLIICNHYPLPENDGANMRTMNFVRFFQGHGKVDIAYSRISPGAQTGNSIFSNEYFLRIKDFRNFRERLISSLVKRAPIPVYEYCDDAYQYLLRNIESHHYDYILVRYIRSTRPLLDMKAEFKSRTIIDFDDLLTGTLYDSEYNSVKGIHKKMILSLNKKLLLGYEKKCLNFGASLFCSEQDKLKMGEKTSNSFVVPNIYNNQLFQYFNFGDGFVNGNNLLFVGSLNYLPNIQGLSWFLDTIFPDYKAKFSNAKLSVVGRSPCQAIKNLCERNANVKLYEDAPDIKKHYSNCKAVIVPLLSGGGTRIKILEAALTRRPVFSTPIGAGGLDMTDEKEILLFEDAHVFCRKYDELGNLQKYNSLVDNARKCVLEKYSVRTFNDSMERVLHGIDDKDNRQQVRTNGQLTGFMS
jgi:glycosyltransferase involved in cell wall biosynthesis